MLLNHHNKPINASSQHSAWLYEIDISRTSKHPGLPLHTSSLQYNIGHQIDCLALADTNCEASFTVHSSTEDGQVCLILFFLGFSESIR
jgi:hypothetical protein